MKHKLSINTILYRDISIKSSNVVSQNYNNYDSAVSAIGESSVNYYPLYSFFKENINYGNANKNATQCMDLLVKLSESENTSSEYNNLLYEFNNHILPYVENINSIAKYKYMDSIVNHESILETIEDLSHADRILSNVNKLEDRTHTLKEVYNYIYHGYSDLRSLLENIYEALDDPFYMYIKKGPKFNVVLEYAIYGLSKLGYNFDTRELVNELTDIVMCKSFTDKDLRSYRNVLENNILLDESDIQDVRYIFESEDFADSNDVENLIKNYKKQAKKDEGTLKRLLTKIFARSPKNIIDETPNILEVIRNCGILSTLAINPVLTLVVFCADKMIEMHFKEKETKRILNYFKKEKSKVDSKISLTKNKEKKERLSKYSKCLDNCISKIEDYNEDINSDDKENISDILDDIDESNSDMERQTANQFLVNAYNQAISEMNTAVQLLANVLYLEDYKIEKIESIKKFTDPNNLNRFITPQGFIQVPIYFVKSNTPDIDNDALYKIVSQICSQVNSQLNDFIVLANNGISHVMILFMSLSPLDVSTEDTDKLNEAGVLIANDLLYSMNSVLEASNTNIEDMIKSITEKIYMNRVDESDLSLFKIGDLLLEYTDNIYIKDRLYHSINHRKNLCDSLEESMKYNQIKNDIYNHIIREDNSINTIEDVVELTEYASMIKSILEKKDDSSIKEKIDKKKQEMNNKKIKKTKDIKNSIKVSKETMSNNVNRTINNAALAMQGLKKDVQNLSDKEKQASRTIDMGFNQLKRGIEKSLISNKREAIIKGSIIPSFSKIIKSAVLFAGTYTLVNPVLAIIGALGAFALSKSLTTKEKQLISDEIEIELNVVEKEIAEAEDNKDMKRYRQLLQYQRKLEREYQRIRYNIKVYSRDVAPVIKRERD